MRIKQWLSHQAAALLLISPAMAQTMPQNGMQGMAMGTHSPADTAMQAGMGKMQHEMMTAPMTGDPDMDFVTMMIPHHQGAISMAKIELQYGKDPEIRKLATAIIAAQQDEIAQMKQWQAKHAGK